MNDAAALVLQLTLLAIVLLQPSHCTTRPSNSTNTNATSVTYPGIGTFNSADWSPPRSAKIRYLPVSPSKINLKFLLYTRSNRGNPETLRWNDTASIRATRYFDGTKGSKVIVPGYTENMTSKEWIGQMKDAFLNRSDVNVFIVDWSGGNGEPYGQAVVNARVAGPMIGIQIRRIIELKRSHFNSFHVIGHSLGCHVAGYTGKFLNGSLGHMTGLDPSGPSFRGLPAEAKLWYTDAQFVDVIHTDSKPVIGFGLEEPCGTVDLYPNGGITQPGCGKDRVEAFRDGGLSEGTRVFFGCDHYRSWAYYIEAIQNGSNAKTRAYRCPNYETFKAKNSSCSTDCGSRGVNCVYLGPKAIEYSGSGNRVRFYLETKKDEPYFG